ncbi:MAG: YbhB/YbcL family Raf kinase inhibitor-like protein [Gammaproteobacteria bacterium]|nr:YbhB/YbcL family Raf kinase inhibitor-like protein [Gammaproteobacteria bacterium]
MRLTSNSFRDGGTIPARCAFALRDPRRHVRLAANRNPHLAWTGAPPATRSFVLICTDIDAPTRPDDVNKEGREVSAALPRADFIHWVVVDIPAGRCALEEGACSQGVAAKGKRDPAGPEGARQGLNDYTGWFKGDPAMEGAYLGYDGPCPPWNDARVHHYRFELFATDLDKCPVKDGFAAKDVRKAIEGHVLAHARLSGRYSLNPRLRPADTPLKLMRKPARARGRKPTYKVGAT